LYKIKKLGISGFRRLYDFEMEMKPFTVIIGINGVGKTTFLDAISLLSASASGNLNAKLSQQGGVGNILTRGKSDNTSFSINMEIPDHKPLEYNLDLVPQGTGYSIASETLQQIHDEYIRPFMHIDSHNQNIRYFEKEENKLLPISWTHNYFETSLSQVPKMFKEPEELRRILATAVMYHTLDVGPQAPVKLPQQMKPAVSPGVNGEDLIPFLFYLRETSKEKFEVITDSLMAAFPDLEELGFPPASAGMLSLTWKDKKFSRPLYIHELSEGILRFLWLVSLLQSSDLSALTMIDEPDVSLHPELMHILVDLMREASARTQLIIATHSDRFVRFLKPEELMVFDLDENGLTTAKRGDSFDLEQWLSEYRLDELWMMGRLTE